MSDDQMTAGERMFFIRNHDQCTRLTDDFALCTCRRMNRSGEFEGPYNGGERYWRIIEARKSSRFKEAKEAIVEKMNG